VQVQIEEVVPTELLEELEALKKQLAAANDDAASRANVQQELEAQVADLKEQLSQETTAHQVAVAKIGALQQENVSLAAQNAELASASNVTDIVEKNKALMCVGEIMLASPHPRRGDAVQLNHEVSELKVSLQQKAQESSEQAEAIARLEEQVKAQQDKIQEDEKATLSLVLKIASLEQVQQEHVFVSSTSFHSSLTCPGM
jgi:FtsZ-binding cell division protein ZapB